MLEKPTIILSRQSFSLRGKYTVSLNLCLRCTDFLRGCILVGIVRVGARYSSDFAQILFISLGSVIQYIQSFLVSYGSSSNID